MRIDQAVIIGCGGTGSHLLEPLARLLAFHKDGIAGRKPGILVVDGDKFEDKNAARQLGVAPGQFKATVALNRIREMAPDALDLPRYLNRVSFKELVLEGIEKREEQNLLVVLSVDNHATRRDILLALHESGHENMLVLSPGNDLTNGQVHIWARVDGEDLTMYPLACDPDGNQAHPELHNPADRIPGGCIEQAPSTPQLITANAMASLGCLLATQAWLDSRPIPDEIVFEANEFKLVPSGGLIGLPQRGVPTIGVWKEIKLAQPVEASPNDIRGYEPGPGHEPPVLAAEDVL